MGAGPKTLTKTGGDWGARRGRLGSDDDCGVRNLGYLPPVGVPRRCCPGAGLGWAGHLGDAASWIHSHVKASRPNPPSVGPGTLAHTHARAPPTSSMWESGRRQGGNDCTCTVCRQQKKPSCGAVICPFDIGQGPRGTMTRHFRAHDRQGVDALHRSLGTCPGEQPRWSALSRACRGPRGVYHKGIATVGERVHRGSWPAVGSKIHEPANALF